MKLISLNIWGGRAYEPLLAWIKEQAQDTDIFCFQEAFESSSDIEISNGTHVHILEDLKKLLPNYEVIYAPSQDGIDTEGPVDFNLSIGPATFVKKPHKIITSQVVFTYGQKNSTNPEDYTTMPSNVLYTKIQSASGQYYIYNFHGIAYPGDKLDTAKRLEQSRNLVNMLAKEDKKKILCGDFNLMPNTESIRMIEETMENLITKFNIPKTRSKISKYYGTPDEQKYADFTFVSSDIKVAGFEVPDVPISDHLPMVLHFE